MTRIAIITDTTPNRGTIHKLDIDLDDVAEMSDADLVAYVADDATEGQRVRLSSVEVIDDPNAELA